MSLPNEQNPFLNSSPVGIASDLLTARPVIDGEPVNAAVTNRLPVVNQGNTAYIHDVLKQAIDTSGQFLWDMPVADEVVVGDFVYYSAANFRFEKALARFEIYEGARYESETSQVWGVVTKIEDNTATICTSGLCQFMAVNSVFLQNPDRGVRFLSDTNPGEPTSERVWPDKCLGFLVGVLSTGAVQFFMRQTLAASALAHQHKSFILHSAPAGSWDSNQASITITDVNRNKPGWLPASDPIFSGVRPDGAWLGYNPVFLSQTCHWPLRFSHNAGLRWQRRAVSSDDPLAASVPQEFYKFDDTTIWWMSPSRHLLPWDINTGYVDGEPIVPPSGDYNFRMWLDYIDSGYGLSDGIVSSLRPVEDSGIIITQHPFGGDAVYGDLAIDLNLTFNSENDFSWKGSAVKSLNGRKTTEGPVVSGIKIDSTTFRILESESSVDNYHYGKLIIGDPTGQIGQEIPFEAIHLNGVAEALEREAIGLSFPQGFASDFLARVQVPRSYAFSSFQVGFAFGILTVRSGNIASDILKLSYRVMSLPYENNTITEAFPAPAALTSIPCDFSVQNNRFTNGYYTVESDKITVKPGDVILLRVERTPPDNYNDRLILVGKSAILYSN